MIKMKKKKIKTKMMINLLQSMKPEVDGISLYLLELWRMKVKELASAKEHVIKINYNSLVLTIQILVEG